MKRAFIFLITLLFPLLVSAQTFTASLSGANEVGGGDPDGAGVAVVTFDGTTVNFTILVSGIDTPTLAHIHEGAAGVDGDVVVNFNPTFIGGTATGSVTTDGATAAAIIGNPAGFYVNVHNAAFPGGAVRGQLSGTAGTGTLSSEFPVVGKVTGANNTNFVTDARIVNSGTATANVTLDYFAQSTGGQASPTATANVTVGPGEQKVLNDVVGTTLGVSDGLGGLEVTSDQPVLISIRVINDLRAQDAGTAGFAAATDEAATSGTITFLTNNGDFRTNVGYFNPGDDAVSATFVAHSTADGSALGTRTISIPGHSMVQQPVFSLITGVASTTQDDFYVTWSSDGPLHVYASVTDNKTGDAVFNR